MAVFQPRPGLGDLIWHLPLIRAIAAASLSGRVVLITKPSTQADVLLEGDPAIERIVWFDRNPRQGRGRHDGALGLPRLVASLRGCGAQSCVLLHHGASLAAAVCVAGIRHRYGYGTTRAQRTWLNRGPFLPRIAPFTEAFAQASAYANAAGFAALPEPAVAIHPLARAAVAARIAGLRTPLAVLGVGSQGQVRQWGAANFARLANALVARGTGTVLLLAAAHEAPHVEAIIAAAANSGRMHAALGWPLPEVAALLADAPLFIGNDSGMMNLRAAAGRPAYALFGASGPLTHSTLIRPIIPPAGPRAGMAAIELSQVLEALCF